MDQQDVFPRELFDKIQEIANLSVGGNYIFRGEPKYHCKISSTLYRECERVVRREEPESELPDFNIEVIEREILKQVKKFIPDGESVSNLPILTQLQHYGSRTNLIDFTTDFNIALFFACDGQPSERGRVIVQKIDLVKTVQPLGAGHRVLAQKSVFVQSEQGYIDPNEANYEVVNIPACLKGHILKYLRNAHGITTETIYNDIHGYIRNRDIHKSAYSEFYIAFAYQNKAEKIENPEGKRELWDKAIEHYDRAVGYNPNFELAYTNLSTLHSKKRENDRAMRDRRKELEINPDRAPGPYTDRDHRAEWMLTEADFISWLAQEENLTLLGKTLGMELELEAQEVNVGGFRADLLCKNTVDDSRVIIEYQLNPTNHNHMGQLLTYAARLDASTVIWIANTFRHEHREMLDWQNQITDERYRFFGVEMKVGQIEDPPRAIQFDVVSSPIERGHLEDSTPIADSKLTDDIHNELSTIAERFRARTTLAERETIGRKVAALRINAEGSKGTAWRKIRKELRRTEGFHLKQEDVREVIRREDHFKESVVERIESFEGGWESNCNLERLLGFKPVGEWLDRIEACKPRKNNT